jgi:alkanesulfonate monooxygenase SsuD/methylene tetrahydromethanopterin reductase-like flavin-dependent oxidoreductase (luciferase family)
VILQAGQSGRGRAFAGRWAEIVFVIQPTMETAIGGYRDIKTAVAAAGRDPAGVKVTPAIYVVPGETRAEAEAKFAVIERLALPQDALELLSEVLNFDFATKGDDEPFTDAELASMTGLRAIVDRVVRLSGTSHPTRADFVRFSGRGTLRELPTFVGSPADIAHEMERWLTAEACDGFVVAATHVPGAYDDFARFVTPELQRRGLLQREYAGTTLRENLGLDRIKATPIGSS